MSKGTLVVLVLLALSSAATATLVMDPDVPSSPPPVATDPAPPTLPAQPAPEMPMPDEVKVPAAPEVALPVLPAAPAVPAPPPSPETPEPKEQAEDVVALVPEDPIQTLEEELRPVREQLDEVQEIVVSLMAEPEEENIAAPQAATPAADVPTTLLVGSILVATATAGAAIVAWLTGTSGTASAAAGGRKWLPYASPLFTRFEKDTVLGHPKREQLYGLIVETPGISLQALCDATNLSRTAVTHHLRLLEHQHIIVSKRVGRSRHYFENGGRYGRDQKDAYAVLQNDRSQAVATFIRSHPGAIQKAVCEALGIHASIAHWHVRRLHEAGLVESVRQGRTVRYFPTPGLQSVQG